MRSVGSEFLSTLIVLAVPLGIVAGFPFSSFRFKAAEVVRCSPRFAFVKMTAEAEHVALRTARTSWRGKVGEARRLKVDLFLAELPEDKRLSVLTVRDRSRPPSLPMASCGRTPFLPSQKAPPPFPIETGTEVESLAFPREDLLRMN